MVKDTVTADIEPALFETEEEKSLYDACLNLADPLAAAYAVYDYGTAVEILKKAVPQINAFLDRVLVMHEDEAVKNNRIHLLTKTFDLIRPMGNIKRLS